MTVRRYLSKVIGDGHEESAFRPSLADIGGINWSGDGGRVNSQSPDGWMLVHADVDSAQHNIIVANADNNYMPFENASGNVLDLTDTIGDIPTAKRNAIAAFLEQHNIPTDDFKLTDTIKFVLRRIVKRFLLRKILNMDDFDESLDLQIKDIPSAKVTRIKTALQNKGFDTSGIKNTTTVRGALKIIILQNNKYLSTALDN